jgi:hypothetical protein
VNLTRREKPGCPIFKLCNSNIVTGTDDSTFVQPPIELYHNLPSPVIINQLELPNVTCQNMKYIITCMSASQSLMIVPYGVSHPFLGGRLENLGGRLEIN